MHVARARIEPYRGQVRGARGAVETWTERSGLVLRVETADGLAGQGEASPLPRYSRDTLDDVERALRDISYGALPVAERNEPAPEYVARLGRAVSSLPPSAAFAVETALLDVLGQRRGVPVWTLLGESRQGAVPLCRLVGSAEDDGVVSAARAAAAEGVHTVKLKIRGPSLGAQLETLAGVRAAIGRTPLRLDANGTFARESLLEELERLGGVDPELVEEPAEPSVLLEVARGRRLPVRVALDESLQDPSAFGRLAPHFDELGCAAMILKPMALGGFARCLDLAAHAEEHGIDVTVSHLFDGPVGLTAAAHLALAVGSRRRASGLDVHGALAAWPAVSLPLHRATTLVAVSTPGLGLLPLPGPS